MLFLDEPTSGEPAMTGEVTNFYFHSVFHSVFARS